MNDQPRPRPEPPEPSPSFDELPSPAVSLALLARAQTGDREALHELLERYQDRLHRIVRIQLGGRRNLRLHDSLDVVQNTFLAALPKINELRPRSPASLLRWLAVIALHEIRDAYDHQHALKRDVGRERSDYDSISRMTRLANLPASEQSPEEQAELAELRELLDEEVVQLPEDQKRVVLLRDYYGEAWTPIAEELRRDEAAARQLHQRAWIRLRGALRSKLEDRPRRGRP
jgi:RNA polymerase sigma-70 factor (ECF subfamily)